MEETPLEAIPAFTPPKRPINKRFVYLVLVILFLLIAFVSYKVFWSKPKEAIVQNSPANQSIPTAIPTVMETPTSTPTPTPTLTPTPTVDPVDPTSGLDRSQLSITVQNGSGEAGVAGKASDVLKSLGYNVAGSGNADNFNYTGVTIQVKSAQVTYLDLLKKDLGFSYTISNATSDLPDSFSSDALVIIGQ